MKNKKKVRILLFNHDLFLNAFPRMPLTIRGLSVLSYGLLYPFSYFDIHCGREDFISGLQNIFFGGSYSAEAH
jgi:hypothetical protein